MQVEKIEEELDLGNLEEVIVMAKDELELIDVYHSKICFVSTSSRNNDDELMNDVVR